MTFGALKSKKDIREYRVASINATNIEIPNEFELPMPEVKNQYEVGSCVAHSIATIVEYFNSLQEGNNKAFSTGYIYGNRRNTNWYGTGMYVDKAINAVVKWGDVYNEKFNYNIEVPDAIAKFEEQAFDLAPDAYPHRFSEFYRLDTDEERKIQLLKNGPIVFSIAWYKDYSVNKNGILTHFSNEIAGYHCMVIYGWNENGWKFQNSWGTGFGKKGRAILPYDTQFDCCYGIKDNIRNKNKEIEDLKKLIATLESNLNEKELELEKYEQSTLIDKKKINEMNKQIESLQQALESSYEKLELMEQLQEELMEIKRPFEKMPTWLAKAINWIINLFK